MQLERLVPEVEIDSETSHDGEVHVFSVNQMGYMGHSQGGLNGALYLAVSERCRGAYLSGAGGGLLYSLVHKTEPVRIRNTIGILVGFTGTTEELDEEDFGIFHPVLNLLQMFYESADGVNYGRYWFWETLPGVPPKSVLMTEGLGDSYSPEATIEALAVAGELDPVLPQLTDPVPGFILKGRDLLIPPVVGNASLDGTVTAGLKQYPESDDYDGHFVSYHDPDAIATWSGFLTQLTTGFVPVIE